LEPPYNTKPRNELYFRFCETKPLTLNEASKNSKKKKTKNRGKLENPQANNKIVRRASDHSPATRINRILIPVV
jgi:hypothetical protein